MFKVLPEKQWSQNCKMAEIMGKCHVANKNMKGTTQSGRYSKFISKSYNLLMISISILIVLISIIITRRIYLSAPLNISLTRSTSRWFRVLCVPSTRGNRIVASPPRSWRVRPDNFSYGIFTTIWSINKCEPGVLNRRLPWSVSTSWTRRMARGAWSGYWTRSWTSYMNPNKKKIKSNEQLLPETRFDHWIQKSKMAIFCPVQ